LILNENDGVIYGQKPSKTIEKPQGSRDHPDDSSCRNPPSGPRCLVQVAGHASADFVVFAEAQGTGDQARGTFRQ